MDVPLATAARLLSAYDPLGALKLVALREDAPALTLRGVAMAQLGDYARARALLTRAARRFGAEEAPARARCLAALGEVLIARRDLAGAALALRDAEKALSEIGDVVNAIFVRLQIVRCALLTGDLAGAEHDLRIISLDHAPARVVVAAALVGAEIAVRRSRASDASAWIVRAEIAAKDAGLATLTAEVAAARARLEAPVARLFGDGAPRLVSLAEVVALSHRDALIVDVRRRELRGAPRAGPREEKRDDVQVVTLVTRPVLFALARALGLATPAGESREGLILAAFDASKPNASHRARLRVEIGRLRREVAGIARLDATPRGFRLTPLRGDRVLVLDLTTPTDDDALIALLASGESWPTSTLATAVGRSQRAVQRALGDLEAKGRARSTGRGRAQRWVAPPPELNR